MFQFKLASLTYKVLHTGIPSYLSEHLHPYVVSSRALRSFSSTNLYVPHTNHFGHVRFILQLQQSVIFSLLLFDRLKP